MVNSRSPSKLGWIRRAENQVSVAGQNTHVIRVLVERVLPSALADHAYQRQFTRMHVGVAVVGLVRILGPIICVHSGRASNAR